MKEAPLWHISDNALARLVKDQRGTKYFVDVLAIILQQTQPVRQEEIWNMMQASPSIGDLDQAELAAFKVTLEAQYENQWNDDSLKWNLSQDLSFERLWRCIRERKAE